MRSVDELLVLQRDARKTKEAVVGVKEGVSASSRALADKYRPHHSALSSPVRMLVSFRFVHLTVGTYARLAHLRTKRAHVSQAIEELERAQFVLSLVARVVRLMRERKFYPALKARSPVVAPAEMRCDVVLCSLTDRCLCTGRSWIKYSSIICNRCYSMNLHGSSVRLVSE